jgi:nitrite reductase/ring-hydroxylating ferredoxin subunit
MGRVSAGNKLGEGEMRILDIDGTKVSVAAAGGSLYAFDDACTQCVPALCRPRATTS